MLNLARVAMVLHCQGYHYPAAAACAAARWKWKPIGFEGTVKKHFRRKASEAAFCFR